MIVDDSFLGGFLVWLGRFSSGLRDLGGCAVGARKLFMKLRDIVALIQGRKSQGERVGLVSLLSRGSGDGIYIYGFFSFVFCVMVSLLLYHGCNIHSDWSDFRL